MTDSTASPTHRLPGVAQLLVAQINYQARLLASGRVAMIGVGLPVILLISSSSRHAHPGAINTAGYAAFGMTMTAWNTHGVRLVAARESGVLKRWRATPLPRWAYFLARIVATVVIATLAGAATILASVALYSLHITATACVGALLALVLGGLAWSAAATALTAAISTVESASSVLLVVYFPTVIASGLLGSINEPHWLTTLAGYLPARPVATLLANALTEPSLRNMFPLHDVIVLCCWAAGGLAIAIRFFRWEPHRPHNARPTRTATRTEALTPQPGR
jgi:ABC-2 type transport system permease protein